METDIGHNLTDGRLRRFTRIKGLLIVENKIEPGGHLEFRASSWI